MIDFRRVLKNPVLLFMTNRYVSYVLLFVRGILVAKFLGPTMFGVWGFLMLVQQYLAYTNLGVQPALNVELSTEDASSELRAELMGTALIHTLMIFCGLVFFGFVIQANSIPLFEKYSFNHYTLAL
ncbi:MAG: hypothetical protein WCK35_26260, partial [Chloroflexota bacterium]